MTLVVLAVLAAGVLAVICRGRPSTFGRPSVRRLGLLGIVLIAWATSSLAKSTGVAAGWLVVAVLALVWFGVLNRGRPGLGLMVVGLGLNALVMIVNGAMPVSMAAIDRAGVPGDRVPVESEAWIESRPYGDPLREDLTDQTVLPWLGEAVPLALPLRPSAASVGDVLLAAGGALFIFTGLTGFGRTVPERMLLPKERRARRKARKAARLADEDRRPEAGAVGAGPEAGAVGAAPLAEEVGRTEARVDELTALPLADTTPHDDVDDAGAVPARPDQTVPGPMAPVRLDGPATDSAGLDSPQPVDAQASAGTVAAPIDPAVASAQAAAAAAAAARKKAQRQIKKRKKQERKQRQAADALALAAARAAKASEAETEAATTAAGQETGISLPASSAESETPPDLEPAAPPTSAPAEPVNDEAPPAEHVNDDDAPTPPAHSSVGAGRDHQAARTERDAARPTVNGAEDDRSPVRRGRVRPPVVGEDPPTAHSDPESASAGAASSVDRSLRSGGE